MGIGKDQRPFHRIKEIVKVPVMHADVDDAVHVGGEQEVDAVVDARAVCADLFILIV